MPHSTSPRLSDPSAREHTGLHTLSPVPWVCAQRVYLFGKESQGNAKMKDLVRAAAVL